jgi:glycosyltransferase involved in cell wall biosynthesis
MTRDLIGSGIDRIMEYQARALVEGGNKVTILTVTGDQTQSGDVTFRSLQRSLGFVGNRVFYFTLPANILWTSRHIRELAKFDALIAHLYPMTWLADFLRRTSHTKYVLYNHGILDTTAMDERPLEKMYVRTLTLLSTATIGKPDLAVSISDYTRRQLKRYAGVDSMIVNNPVDNKFLQLDSDSSKAKETLNLGSSPVLLFVGLVEPRKGIHLLLKTHEIVKRKFPDTKLVIVGRIRYPRYFSSIATGIDSSVKLVGWVSSQDLATYYAACDVYVTASSWEGFDMPVAEAQASGKPVVAFDIGAHREIVDDGRTGFLAGFGDVNAFSEMVLALLSNAAQRKEMGARARLNVQQKFSSKRFSLETQNLIRSLF